jgi:uncharacterized membrane protein YfcA
MNNISDFLFWIVNSGGSIAVVSYCLEYWKWYQDKEANIKKSLFFMFSCLVSVLAYLVLNYVPADVLNQIAPYFAMTYACFVTVFLGEGFHAVTKSK